MRKKLYTFILFLLVVATDIALGKDGNKTKIYKPSHKKTNNMEKLVGERLKRSLNDDIQPFWSNRGKKLAETVNYVPTFQKGDKGKDFNKEPPFWGARGRRDSFSSENYNDLDYPEYTINTQKINKCIDCRNPANKLSDNKIKDRRDDMSPFWGNRGRRNDDDGYSFEPFWSSRGRRQDNEPFWGNRGKKEDEPFWGNRGKKEDEPFWGNRGRRQGLFRENSRKREDEPFWGNRGRREDSDPFWGNRGRRQENEPFWGNRGRRNDEPFWGNRGRRKLELFWDARRRSKYDLKEDMKEAINNVQNDIENLSRFRRSNSRNFWSNRGRNSKLKNVFNGERSRLADGYVTKIKPAEPGTVHNNKIYVEEPQYILVERNSRSSGEDDPFFITRGKKYYVNYNLLKAVRDRRGAIDEIVKSVRNDPYYVARGKKDDIKNENATQAEESFKAKELICAAIDLITYKDGNRKFKREVEENERNRRTTLNKLAAQLQMDPYFISRGKKNEVPNNEDDYLPEFISDVAEKCD